MSTKRTLVIVIAIGIVIGIGSTLFQFYRNSRIRSQYVRAFLNDPAARAQYAIEAGARCGTAPFIFPTTGMAGYLWDDSFQLGHRHQGIDIFAGTDIDVAPVVAAYPGFLTRLPDWKSSVIVRVPSDPFQPGRQIWVYYTHMADPNGNSFIDPEFPPGTSEKPVEAGTLLGHQGDYSGDPNSPVGVHLHISIVKDQGGNFMNELDINNTYDPSPYFGLALNAKQNPDKVPMCEVTTGDAPGSASASRASHPTSAPRVQPGAENLEKKDVRRACALRTSFFSATSSQSCGKLPSKAATQ